MCSDCSGHHIQNGPNPTVSNWVFSLHCLINRFHVAVRLFSNRSQMTSKCGKNKKVAHEAQSSVSLMFLPHFDVLCDLLLNLSLIHI